MPKSRGHAKKQGPCQKAGQTGAALAAPVSVLAGRVYGPAETAMALHGVLGLPSVYGP